MAIEIIEATESNIPDIVELWLEFMDYHIDIDSRGFTMRAEALVSFKGYLRDLIAAEDKLVLVAQDGNRTVGFSISRVNQYPPIWQERETYGFIDSTAVTADYRRKGVGEQLLSRIFEWFASRDIDNIEVAHRDGNIPGSSFWRKHGFRDFEHRLYLRKK